VAICSLIYSSKLDTPDPSGIVESILDAAQRNNPALGLTGALVFDERHFVQLLEGSRASVSEMFLRISQDARHGDVHLISVGEDAMRRFATWSMHHAAMRGKGPVSARAFIPHGTLEPAAFSVQSAFALFDEVARLGKRSAPDAA
jgi:hypothetical protein